MLNKKKAETVIFVTRETPWNVGTLELHISNMYVQYNVEVKIVNYKCWLIRQNAVKIQDALKHLIRWKVYRRKEILNKQKLASVLQFQRTLNSREIWEKIHHSLKSTKLCCDTSAELLQCQFKLWSPRRIAVFNQLWILPNNNKKKAEK